MAKVMLPTLLPTPPKAAIPKMWTLSIWEEIHFQVLPQAHASFRQVQYLIEATSAPGPHKIIVGGFASEILIVSSVVLEPLLKLSV